MTIKPTLQSASGTSLVGFVRASYAELVSLFGEPNGLSDGYKVSTKWNLDRMGRVWTLYDYKETDAFAPGRPSVEEFRALPSHLWHVGGSSEQLAPGFINELQAMLTDRRWGPSPITVELANGMTLELTRDEALDLAENVIAQVRERL